MRRIVSNFIFLGFVLSVTQAFVPTKLSTSTSSTTHGAIFKNKYQCQNVQRQISLASTSPLFVDDRKKQSSASKLKSTASTYLDADAAVTSTDAGKMNPIKAKITKAGMISFVASMCIALPATLYPVRLLHKVQLINTLQKEQLSCRVGCFCSRWLMRLIPFANVKVIHNKDKRSSDLDSEEPEPTIWVCNHTSMLDIFLLLANDKKMRGKNKRPIKIIYWKDLEKNPVTKLLFTMSGFIPVEMEDNGNGNTNTYKKSSFKALLKSIKKAFDDGFDIGILPEGQLNPTPEKGLQPIFGGAFTLSRMSKRPIKMMAIHGLHRLWHGDEEIGMTVTGRKVQMRNYNLGGKFANSSEFVEAFKQVVGHFGATGKDNPKWKDWVEGIPLIEKKEMQPQE